VNASARRHGSAVTASLRADEKPYRCGPSAVERLVTDAPPDDTADLEAPGFIVQRV
jgi:hypothetical protein